MGSVETTESAEARQSVVISTARWPKVGGEKPLGSKDAEHVGLRNRPCDVVPAAGFVLRDREPRTWKFRVDFGLQASQNLDRRAAKFLEDPGIVIVIVIEGWVPQVARALHDELHLSGSQGGAAQFSLPVVDSLEPIMHRPKNYGIRKLVLDGLRECDGLGDVIVGGNCGRSLHFQMS